MKKVHLFGMIACVLIFAMCLAACSTGQSQAPSQAQGASSAPQASGEPYYIAFAQPLTGDYANQGTESLNAVMIAVDEINAAGGINGREIVVETFDDKNDPTEAANIAQRIVSDDKYIAVIGSYASGATMAGAPIYQDNIIHLSPTGSSTLIPESGTWTWQMSTDVHAQYSGWTKEVCERLGAETISIIYIDGDNGKQILDEVTNTAPDFGAEVIASDKFITGQTRDFTSILQMVSRDNPDVIGIFCSYADSSAMVMQARDLGIETTIVLSPDSYNQYLLDALGDTPTEGLYVFSLFAADAEDPNIQSFAEEYHALYDYYPSQTGAGGYECANLIIRGLQAGVTDGQSFYEFMSGLDKTEGKIFNDTLENRRVVRDLYFLSEVADGRFKCLP